MDVGKDESAVEELEFDLNENHETRPDLTPKSLDADGLFDFDGDLASNKLWNCGNISSDEDEFSDESILPLSQTEVDGAIENLSKLTLFTTDWKLDPLLHEVFNKIN